MAQQPCPVLLQGHPAAYLCGGLGHVWPPGADSWNSTPESLPARSAGSSQQGRWVCAATGNFYLLQAVTLCVS